MKSMRVAIGQIFCLDGDRLGNLQRMEYAIQEAKRQNAELVCFPEMAIYGWVNPQAHERADRIPGRDSERLCELAKEYQIHLCTGVAEKDGDALHDSAILVDDRGHLLLKHRKMNILTELMKPAYIPGTKIQVTETVFGTIGMLICADTFIGEHLERMKSLKPDLVLVPYGWAAEENEWPEHGKSLHETVHHVARSIGAPVVGTDLVGAISFGPWKGRTYGGQSIACGKDGNDLAILKDRDREVRVVEIPLSNS